MRSFTLPSVLLVAAFSPVAAAPIPKGERTPPKSWLKDGTEVEYTVTVTGPNFKGLKPQKQVTKVAEVKQTEAGTLFKTTIVMDGQPKTESYCLLTPKGVVSADADGQPSADPPAPLPEAKVGAEWKTKTKIGDLEYDDLHRIEAEEEIEVPAGRYKTFRQQVVSKAANITNDTRVWSSTQVGLVRCVTETKDMTISTVLTKIKPGK